MSGITDEMRAVIDRAVMYRIPQDVIESFIDEYQETEVAAHESGLELKRFIAMCQADPYAGYALFGPVDRFWHIWLQHTQLWFKYGESVLGKDGYIHHTPLTRSQKRQIRASGVVPSGYTQFLADYSDYFEMKPPARYWPAPKQVLAFV